MVTVIVIPIICIYFYFITKKEMKKHDRMWLSVGQIPHESALSGEIKTISEEKQRYYLNRYIYIQELKLQTTTKLLTIRKITPLTKKVERQSFHAGESILVYGCWREKFFYFNDYQTLSPSSKIKY